MSTKLTDAVESVWGTYDLNNDNLLDRAESQKFFDEIINGHEKLQNLPDFETFFTGTDADKDGHISKEELTAFLRAHLKEGEEWNLHHQWFIAEILIISVVIII